MKKLLSLIMAISVMACLFVPVASAAQTYPVYTDKLYQAFENEADLNNLYKWDITTEFSNEGAFGSSGAAKLFSSSVNGGAEYRMYLTEGKMYRFSVLVKPLDFELSSANLILLTEAEEGGSGWEQVSMSVGTANAEGYIPVSVEYRVSDRVYPGSQKAPLDKKEGAQTRVVFRMNKENITYLLDEVKVEPVDYVAFENFDNASNIPHKVTQPTASTDGTSETYSANIIAHNQSNYSINTAGFAHIAGSGTKGVYFPNLTLMPVTTYRISANITTGYDIVVFPYYMLESSLDGTIAASGHKALGSGIAVSAGANQQHVEFLFRTEGKSTKNYINGITFNKFGLVTNGSYVIWDCDNIKIEKVDDFIGAGDMENLTVISDGTKVVSNTLCSAGQTPIITRDGKNATLEIAADDGTNADRGSYLKLNCVGVESANSTSKDNNRRAIWYVNLKPATTYRISFWTRIISDDPNETHDLGAMHNMGKVDAGGFVSSEEGWTGTGAAYGYINSVTGIKVKNQWQYISKEFTTQNRHQLAPLYIGVDNYQPKNDVTLAIDELNIEEVGTTYYDATVSYADGVLTAAEKTGAQVSGADGKVYTFFVSNDGVNYAKAGESTDGTFATENYIGKYMKAVVSATKADGTVISAESDKVLIPGFSLKFTSDLSADSVSAVARYYPAANEVENFDGIIALYTENNELIVAENFTSVENIANMSAANSADASYAKIFIWDSLANAIPVIKSVTITK